MQQVLSSFLAKPGMTSEDRLKQVQLIKGVIGSLVSIINVITN